MKKALFMGILVGCGALAVNEPFAQTSSPKIGFSGFVDADFTTTTAADLTDPQSTSGLEADLTTAVTFSPRLSAFLYTTLNDGAVPSQGAGNTWTDLRFDGVAVNWRYTRATTLMMGTMTSGSGYFNYYLYKRTAAAVSEERVFGAGFRNGGLTVQTGVAQDSIGPSQKWDTYVEWRKTVNSLMTWIPSARYTAGVNGAWPFELGITFEGRFEDALKVNAHFGMNYWSNDYDAGTLVLIEPSYTYDRYSVSAMLLYNDKGEVPAPNSLQQTTTGIFLDDFVFYVEPGYSINKLFSAGLPIEYHNKSLNSNRDESFWLVPTLYVYPAKGAQWSLWTRITKPVMSGRDGNPYYSLGSEISFRF